MGSSTYPRIGTAGSQTHSRRAGQPWVQRRSQNQSCSRRRKPEQTRGRRDSNKIPSAPATVKRRELPSVKSRRRYLLCTSHTIADYHWALHCYQMPHLTSFKSGGSACRWGVELKLRWFSCSAQLQTQRWRSLNLASSSDAAAFKHQVRRIRLQMRNWSTKEVLLNCIQERTAKLWTRAQGLKRRIQT